MGKSTRMNLYPHYLDGIEENSNIFIGTLGARRNNQDRNPLEKGFEKVCEIIKPKFVMSYGSLTEKMKNACMKNGIPYKEYIPQSSRVFGGMS